MGLLAKIGSLFGSTSVAENVTEAVSGVVKKDGLLDNAFYTEQEKAQVALKAGETWLELQKVLANENSLRSITRRLIAWAFVAEFILLLNVCVFCLLFWKEKVQGVIDIAAAFQLGWIMLAIVTFYFGSYGAAQLIKTKKE